MFATLALIQTQSVVDVRIVVLAKALIHKRDWVYRRTSEGRQDTPDVSGHGNHDKACMGVSYLRHTRCGDASCGITIVVFFGRLVKDGFVSIIGLK